MAGPLQRPGHPPSLLTRSARGQKHPHQCGTGVRVGPKWHVHCVSRSPDPSEGGKGPPPCPPEKAASTAKPAQPLLGAPGRKGPPGAPGDLVPTPRGRGTCLLGGHLTTPPLLSPAITHCGQPGLTDFYMNIHAAAWTRHACAGKAEWSPGPSPQNGGRVLLRLAHRPAGLSSGGVLPLTDSGGWGMAVPSRAMPTFGRGAQALPCSTQRPSLVVLPPEQPIPSPGLRGRPVPGQGGRGHG